MKNLTLEHYTAKPFALDRARDYSARQRYNFKPVGLWVSVKGERDWPWFCEREEFRCESLRVRSVVTLEESVNVLTLKTVNEIWAFDARFGRDSYGIRQIDWGQVKKRYDGIIIAPYQWSLRLDNKISWYYPWDVSSGCIWNLDVIESVVSETEEK